MSSFGRRVEMARKSRGYTRRQLCARVQGMSVSSLRDLEVIDSTPRGLQRLLPRLAHELGKSIVYLLTGNESASGAQITTEIDRIETSCQKIRRQIT